MPAAHHALKLHATPPHLGKRRLQLPLDGALHGTRACSDNSRASHLGISSAFDDSQRLSSPG